MGNTTVKEAATKRAIDDPATSVDSADGLTEEELRQLETSFIDVVRWVLSNSRRTNGKLDRAGYVALATLERHGAVRLSELACHLALDLSTVSRQVKNLEDQGFVRRAEDPEDRRASVLTLTDEGSDELHLQRASRWAPVADRLSVMPADRRSKVLQLLDDLADACTTNIPGKAAK